MPVRMQKLQNNAVKFFNSLPFKFCLEDLKDRALELKGAGFLTRETVEKKFGLNVDKFYSLMEETGFIASKVEVTAPSEVTTHCLGVLFALTANNYKKGMKLVSEFIEDSLSEYSNETVDKLGKHRLSNPKPYKHTPSIVVTEPLTDTAKTYRDKLFTHLTALTEETIIPAVCH